MLLTSALLAAAVGVRRWTIRSPTVLTLLTCHKVNITAPQVSRIITPKPPIRRPWILSFRLNIANSPSFCVAQIARRPSLPHDAFWSNYVHVLHRSMRAAEENAGERPSESQFWDSANKKVNKRLLSDNKSSFNFSNYEWFDDIYDTSKYYLLIKYNIYYIVYHVNKYICILL